MKRVWWMKQFGLCFVVVVAAAMLAGVAWADPSGTADVPQIVQGFTDRPGPFSIQRTFLTTETLAFKASYYDPNAACAGVAPTFVQVFVFNLEGLFLFQFNADNGPSSLGSKYRDIGVGIFASSLGPGSYKFTALVRDCTNTKSVVMPEFLTLRVIAP